MTKNYILFSGRHTCSDATDGAIFDCPVNPVDFEEMERIVRSKLDELKAGDSVNLYVTGLTAATLAVVKVCLEKCINLVAYHYDTATGTYRPQSILCVEETEAVRKERYNG